MKRNYLIAGSITLLISVVVFLLWLIQPNIGFFDSITTFRYYPDISKDISFNFDKAHVSVNEWGKKYVEVSYDNMFGKKKKLDISAEGNTLSLNSQLDFSSYKHMNINVPKAVINIIADKIYAKSGTFRIIKANFSSFRYCSMQDGFISEGGELNIRESRLSGESIIRNEKVNFRECDSENVILSSENSGSRINAFLRELTGNSLKLDAVSCKSLIIELKDATLNKLDVDYPGKNGEITAFSSKIAEIRNNSKIKIKYKKNRLG